MSEEQTTVEVIDPAEATAAIAEYSPTEAALAELQERFGGVVWDLTTVKGNADARAARRELVTLRTNLEAKRKALKAPALEYAKRIDSEAKRIAAAIGAVEEPIDAQIKGIDTTAQGWRTKLPMPKVVEFDKDHDYFVRMETNKGPILIKFLPDVAPMHVTAFMYLTKLGFYDGLNFHRVITGFMAQGGDPLGNGRGGPGYGFGGEFDPGVKHNRPGLLSMANTGQPNSDGSQFFLTFVPTPWLDGKHTIFGEVVEGMDTVKALEAVGSKGGQTSEPVGMQVVKVEVRKKS